MSKLGRFVKFLRNPLALALDDSKAWDMSLWQLGGAQSSSGENVTEDSALTYSAVWAATSLIAGTVASLPLNLIQRRNGRTLVVDSNPAHGVLHAEPNEYMTAMSFREAMMAHILLWGNGFAEIVRDGMGRVIALWPITPNRVRLRWLNDEVVYEITMSKESAVILPRDQVLHIPGLGFDGFQGYGVVTMARKSIGLGMAMETFGSLYFGQGTHPGVVLSHPGKLSPDGHKNLEESLSKAHSGLGQAHRLMLLQEAMKVEKIGIAPEESQFLESRQFHVAEIARWFNVPPHKLRDLSKSSFNNIEAEQISFVTDSILPWLIRLEQNYNKQLLNPNEKRRMYWNHKVEGIMRGSAKDRAVFYRQMWNLGAMTQNEIRALEDMDPSDSPYADELFVPLNMTPISLVDKKEASGKPPAEDIERDITNKLPPARLIPKKIKGGSNEN